MTESWPHILEIGSGFSVGQDQYPTLERET